MAKRAADNPGTRRWWWKRLRYRLEYWGLVAAGALVARLPYDALEPLASFLGGVVFALDGRGRAVALENLKAAFGDQYCPEEREILARESYRSFARTMLCLFWSPNLRQDNYREYIRVEGETSDPAHLDPTKPGIYFLGHYSNFEWLALFSSYALQPGILIAQNFKNELLNPVFDRLRSGTGHKIISRDRAILRMMKHLKSGGKVGAAADLSIDPRLGAVPVRCFGLWTAGSPMASALSMRDNIPLFQVDMLCDPDGRFTMRFGPRLELPEGATPAQVTQACWDALEDRIRERPELWLWNYKQWRFKPSRGDTSRYPSYSQVSKRFDKMLEGAGILQEG